MSCLRFRELVLFLLVPWTNPLSPRRHHLSTPTLKSSLPVALVQPPPAKESTQIARNVLSKTEDKEANEYRWLTWVYQNIKDVPFGELDPDIVKQFVPALAAYGRRQTSQSAQQAEALLMRYIEEYRAGNRVIPLENTAFHAVMDAYSKCAEPEKAQQVLQQMIDLAKSEECFSHLETDVFSFTILATAWARSRHPNAADRAERLLEHMEIKGMNVTTITYNVVLKAIAVSHDPYKATRAAKIVRKMQRLVACGQTHATPDLYTYQTWIHACSRTRGGVPQTMEIFKYLDEESAGGNIALRPNAYCFAAAIHAWAYSSEPNKAKRAYELLQDMRQRYEIYGQKACRPNVVVFTSVINACVKPATSEDKETAFQIAQLVFEDLINSPYGSPNFLTYASFLHACTTAIDDENERDSAVRRIFGLCRQYGCVGKIVLQKLEEAASPELFKELMGPFDSWDDIPRSWKCRVKGERFRLLNDEPVSNACESSECQDSTRSKAQYSQESILHRSSFSQQFNGQWEIQFL